MEILSGLSQRLQQRMRMLPLNNSHLSELYRLKRCLPRWAVLQRLELKHLSQLDTLRTLIRSMLNGWKAVMSIRFECHEPGCEYLWKSRTEEVKWVYVVQPENQPNAEDQTTAPGVRQWKPFVAGMCSMLVICVAVAWGWAFCPDPTPTTQAIASWRRYLKCSHLFSKTR
jgi:type VI secretion system protein VasL